MPLFCLEDEKSNAKVATIVQRSLSDVDPKNI